MHQTIPLSWSIETKEHQNHIHCPFAINKGHNSRTVQDIIAKIIFDLYIVVKLIVQKFHNIWQREIKIRAQKPYICHF